MENKQCKGEFKGLRGRIKKEPKKTLSSQVYAGRAAGLAILARHRAWEGRVKLVRQFLKRQHPKRAPPRVWHCGSCMRVLQRRDIVFGVMRELPFGSWAARGGANWVTPASTRSSSICSSI